MGVVRIGVVSVITAVEVLPASVLVRVMVLRGVMVMVLVVFIVELKDAVMGETTSVGLA